MYEAFINRACTALLCIYVSVGGCKPLLAAETDIPSGKLCKELSKPDILAKLSPIGLREYKQYCRPVPAVKEAAPTPGKSLAAPTIAAPSTMPLRSTLGVDALQFSPYLLLRQDQYDEINFAHPFDAGEIVQGASGSFAGNLKAGTQTATINAFAGLSLFNGITSSAEQCRFPYSVGDGTPSIEALGVGAFVQADGTYNHPTSATEKSAMRAGFASEMLACNAQLVPNITSQVYPYWQTDLRGKARMVGFDGLVEPTDVTIKLGGRTNFLDPKWIAGYYFRLIGEANVFHVYNSGLTNFAAEKSYAFLGGTADIRAVLFENNPNVPSLICGRIVLIGTGRVLWDAISNRSISNYGGEIDYNLTGSASTADCKGGTGEFSKNGVTGSLSLSYTRGTDPLTYVFASQYKAGLKLSY